MEKLPAFTVDCPHKDKKNQWFRLLVPSGFPYQLIAKPGNKTAAPSSPDPFVVRLKMQSNIWVDWKHIQILLRPNRLFHSLLAQPYLLIT